MQIEVVGKIRWSSRVDSSSDQLTRPAISCCLNPQPTCCARFRCNCFSGLTLLRPPITSKRRTGSRLHWPRTRVYRQTLTLTWVAVRSGCGLLPETWSSHNASLVG